MGGGEIRAPPKRRVCFDGNPLGGGSLRLLDFTGGGNVGSPDTLYCTEITGSSVDPEGWYFEHTKVFGRVDLKKKDGSNGRAAPGAPPVEKSDARYFHRPRIARFRIAKWAITAIYFRTVVRIRRFRI